MTLKTLLKDYWGVITTIIVFVAAVGAAAYQLRDHERRITKIEDTLAVVQNMDAKLDRLLLRRRERP